MERIEPKFVNRGGVAALITDIFKLGVVDEVFPKEERLFRQTLRDTLKAILNTPSVEGEKDILEVAGPAIVNQPFHEDEEQARNRRQVIIYRYGIFNQTSGVMGTKKIAKELKRKPKEVDNDLRMALNYLRRTQPVRDFVKTAGTSMSRYFFPH